MSLGSSRPARSAEARRRPRGVLAGGGIVDQMTANGLPLAADNSDFAYKALLARISGTGSYGVAMERLLASRDYPRVRHVLLQTTLVWCVQRMCAARVLAALSATVRPGTVAMDAAEDDLDGETARAWAAASSEWRGSPPAGDGEGPGEGWRERPASERRADERALQRVRESYADPFEPLSGALLLTLWRDAAAQSGKRLRALAGQEDSRHGTNQGGGQ